MHGLLREDDGEWYAKKGIRALSGQGLFLYGGGGNDHRLCETVHLWWFSGEKHQALQV